MQRIFKVILLAVLIVSTSSAFAQRQKPQNYRKFDRKLLHFGFMLGGNNGDFTLVPKDNLLQNYGVLHIANASVPGFQLGIISSMKIGHPTFRMRFIPSLSFQERVINYSFVDPNSDDPIFAEQRIGSTNLDFPLLFKYRTLRYNNFAAYFIAGPQYTLDLQSKQEASQSFTEPFLKLNKHDFQGQIGAGVDFFLPYFKFGFEIKLSHGLRNALIQDDTRVSSPIDKLYNRIWWFSLTFEG